MSFTSLQRPIEFLGDPPSLGIQPVLFEEAIDILVRVFAQRRRSVFRIVSHSAFCPKFSVGEILA